MTQGVNVLFGRKAGKISELQLDANLSEQHSYENDVTMFPVEAGSDISDNVKVRPDTITIQGFITNSPLIVLYEDISEVIEKTPGEYDVKATSRANAVNRVELAQDILLRISGRQIQGANLVPEKVDIVTGLRVHTGMMLTSLDMPRDGKTGQAMFFTASFIKMETADSETIVIPNPKPTFKDKTQSKVDEGKQTPTDASTDESVSVSLIKRAYDAAIRAGDL